MFGLFKKKENNDYNISVLVKDCFNDQDSNIKYEVVGDIITYKVEASYNNSIATAKLDFIEIYKTFIIKKMPITKESLTIYLTEIKNKLDIALCDELNKKQEYIIKPIGIIEDVYTKPRFRLLKYYYTYFFRGIVKVSDDLGTFKTKKQAEAFIKHINKEPVSLPMKDNVDDLIGEPVDMDYSHEYNFGIKDI